LTQQQCAIEINPLARNLSFVVKIKDGTSRNLKLPIGGRNALPGGGMLPAKDHLNDDALTAHVLLCDLHGDMREAPSASESLVEPVL